MTNRIQKTMGTIRNRVFPIRTGLLFIFAFLFLCSNGLTADSQKETAPAAKVPIQIHGDSVEYFREEQKAIGVGHVTIDYEEAHLEADKITVYTAEQKAYAEGNVVLKQKGSVFKGTNGEYDFAKKIGYVSNLDATISPFYYAKAKKIERVSPGEYKTSDTSLTTCCGDSPFYKVQAKQVDVYPGEKVEAKNAVLYVKNVPILFLPFFSHSVIDHDRFPVQLVPGKTSDWGAFLLSKWRYYLINTPEVSSKGNVLLDYRAKRGLGGGVDNFYKGEKVGRGSLRYYAVNDQDPPANTRSNRYRAQWRHQQKLTRSTTLTAEVNKLSDQSVVKDFMYREEYETNMVPPNYISLITAKPEYSLSVLESNRINDFFTQVERQPQIRFDTHQQQFSNTPFYLRQEVQFDSLEKKYADNIGNFGTVERYDLNETLTYAGHVGKVSVAPHVGTRQTFYSENIGGREDARRGIFDTGIDVSTKFYKVYDVYLDQFGLDYNQIRHIFAPSASYNYRPRPTLSPVDLFQFDTFDALDRQNYVTIDFENRFQTKYHDGKVLRSRDLARFILFFDIDFPNRAEAIKSVGTRSEWQIYHWLGVYADTVYNTVEDNFDVVNGSVYFAPRRDLRISIGQSFLYDESNQSTADVVWKINEQWYVHFYERYEFEEKRMREFQTTLSRTFDCVILDFTYEHRNEGAVDGHKDVSDSFYFMFRLKAFPNVPFRFSKSYSRPRAPAYEPAGLTSA